ncbi:MAG: helix-turn-helix domain-containing protein [Oscillospiraceae bacterium]|nr:helix-turn-helix domain-containing protein [Oscillospiraceae bacterium]
MELHDRIQQLRKVRGISQEELGEQVEVSRQAVSKWESGQSMPDVDKIIALAALFGVSTDYLLTGAGDATNVSPPRKIDMRIFTAVGTVINMLGLMLLVDGVWVFSGWIFMAVGCMLFGAGLIFATEHKARAVQLFTLVNLWPLLYTPLRVAYNMLRHSLNMLPLHPAIHWAINFPLAFWLGYVAFCLLAMWICWLVWWRKKDKSA